MHIGQLQESDRNELQRILDTDLNALTEDDKNTLRARRDYLTQDQRKFYDDILNTGHEDAQAAQAADEEIDSSAAADSSRASVRGLCVARSGTTGRCCA